LEKQAKIITNITHIKKEQNRLENRVDNLENKVDRIENKVDRIENKVDRIEKEQQEMKREQQEMKKEQERMNNAITLLEENQGKKIDILFDMFVINQEEHDEFRKIIM